MKAAVYFFVTMLAFAVREELLPIITLKGKMQLKVAFIEN